MAGAGLTGETPRRTSSRMADKDRPPKPAPGSREAKLAEALRANLRRRKATLSTAAAPKPRETSMD